MPNWKKVITSGSKAVLQTLEVNPQPSSATTTHGANLQIMSSGSGTQYGLLISGSTFNGIPLALIQTSGSGTTGQGEFIYGKGKNGEDSFRIRQGAGGAGTFALFCSESNDRQFITHQFSDPTQGAVSYVNYSEDSRSNAYFGIGVNNPSSHLHVSGNAILTGDIQIGTGTVAISGSAGTISASGAISASDLFLGGGSDSFIDVNGHITASGNISASGDGLGHTLGGRVSINYGNGGSMTGSLSNGEGYGEIVQFGPMNSAVTKGDVVSYRNASVGWIRADKDTGYAATSIMGVCIDPAADGSTTLTDPKILLKGVVRLGAGHIADTTGDEGDPVYLQDNGHVTFAAPTAGGDYVRIVGYVIDESLDIIYLDPDKTWVEIA